MYINRPFHHFCSTAVMSLLIAGAGPTLAEEIAPPVALEVNDIAPVTGFPEGAVTDVLGLNIGMTQAEAEAALANAGLPLMENAELIPDAKPFGPQRMGYRARSGEVAPTFNWADGFKMSFQPIPASAGWTMYAEQIDAFGAKAEFTDGQYLWIAFGSPSVGGRVQEIRRSQMLDAPVDTQVMVDSITAKYGTPSLIKEVGNFRIDITYYYKDGRLVAEGDRGRILFARNCQPPGISRGNSDVLYSDVNANVWFGNGRDPRASRELCDANISVQLHFGDMPNTIDQIEVHVIDNVARFENATAITAQAEAVHAEWLESVAGSSTVPDL